MTAGLSARKFLLVAGVDLEVGGWSFGWTDVVCG
jgi:hypothetical protein